jgi:hypothetical protein
MPSFLNSRDYSFYLGSYDPLVDLQPKLAYVWDAGRSDLITRDGAGLVSEWRSAAVVAPMVQATAAKQPVYSATSFGGFAGVTFDGVDDELTYTMVGGERFPLGALPFECWVVASSASDGTDTTQRNFFSYGNSGGLRVLARIGDALHHNRMRGNINGAGSANVNPGADLGIRFFSRVLNTGTTTTVQVNDKTDYLNHIQSAPLIPATITGRARIGAAAAGAGSNWIKGTIAYIAMFDKLLTIDESDTLATYIKTRWKL